MNNKILLPLVVFVGILGFCVFSGELIIKKITDRVIVELRRTYAPGPYSPGFDPDKVSPKFFQDNKPLEFPYENAIQRDESPKWDSELWEKSR